MHRLPDRISALVDQLSEALHHPALDPEGWAVSASLRDDADEMYLAIETTHHGQVVAQSAASLVEFLRQHRPDSPAVWFMMLREAVDAAERAMVVYGENGLG